MTLIGPGTWEAARAAADMALTAADLVLGGRAGGVRVLPPARAPRHAGALRRLVLSEQHGRRGRTPARRAGRSGGRARRRRPPRQRHAGDLLRGPRRARRARSTSTPAPAGFRTSSASRARRVPAPTATCRWRPGAGDEDWLAAVRALAQWARGAPRSGRGAGRRRRRRATRRARCRSPPPASAPPAARSARCGLPTVVVQEGGYDLDAIGALVHEFLTGLEEGADE